MKPKEPKPDIIYRIHDRETGIVQGSYSRAYCDETDFTSLDDARNSNCHGLFKDKLKYRVAKYRVKYELIDEDVDAPSKDEIEKLKKHKAFLESFNGLSIHEVIQKLAE